MKDRDRLVVMIAPFIVMFLMILLNIFVQVMINC